MFNHIQNCLIIINFLVHDPKTILGLVVHVVDKTCEFWWWCIGLFYIFIFFDSHIQINLSFVTCALFHKYVPYNDLNFVIFKLILKYINMTSELELKPIVAPWHSIWIELLMSLVFPWWIELLTWLCDFHVVLIIWMLLGIKFYNFLNDFLIFLCWNVLSYRSKA
jgi:hypothetical protein